MDGRKQGGMRLSARWLLGLVPVGALTLAVLQWLNHDRVHGALCALDGLACTGPLLPTAFDVQGVPSQLPATLLAEPLHLHADTGLLRRSCAGEWVLGFGARMQLDPVSVGERLASGSGCVDVLRQGLHASMAAGRLRHGDCEATLESATLDWTGALTATLRARLAPQSAAGCAALLPAALATALAQPAGVQRVELGLRYGLPYTRREAMLASSGNAAGATGWVRRALAAADTLQQLRIDLPDGSVSLQLASTPGAPATGSSPALTLTAQAQGSVVRLLPEAVKPLLAAPAPLTVRWHLDHEDGVVQVDGQRFERVAAQQRPPGPTPLPAAECGPAHAAAPPALHFVEADDSGQPVDPAQSRALFGAVDDAVAGPGALVAVFVHGWQHSAATGDSYVCDYGRLIGAIDTMEQQAAHAAGRPPRTVLGVYVGWPGRLYAGEIANGTTFWNRLQAADRLGAQGALLRPLIAGLAQRVARGRPDPRADRRSALVVTGHSLGARAVFQSLRDALLLPDGSAQAAARPDLVLLVNPAFSAEQYRAIHDRERRCEPIGMPLVSLSSEADLVTRQVYPAGQAVTFDAAARQAAPFPEHVYTAANFGAFVTHRLRMEVLDGQPPRPDGAQTIVRGFARVPAGSNELYADNPVTVFHQPHSGRPALGDAWYRLHLQPVAGATSPCPQDASRVVEVDARVLPDHGTVFTPAFMEYVVRLLNRQTMAHAGAPAPPR